MDDAVAFFTHMTIAMKIHPYFACGHADNAFHASSLEPKVDANQWRFPPSSVQWILCAPVSISWLGFMVSRLLQ